MTDMKTMSYLLPYRFKKVGWGLLIAAHIVLALSLLSLNVLNIIPQTVSRYITMIMYMLFFSAVFVLVLTEEKEEDEMVMSIRRKCVSHSALISFVFYMMMTLVVALSHGVRRLASDELYSIHAVSSNIMTPLAIYLLIFRISIRRVRRQCMED